MNKQERIRAEQETRNWIQNFVIGLNLCPFAKREVDRGSLRLMVSEAENVESLLFVLQSEILLLDQDEDIETTIVIHPNVLNDFLDFNDFLDITDDLLEQSNKSGIYQIASFHPQYQFAETEVDDVDNYTNRSPYPMLHILREASLERAIKSHPDTNSIPVRNKKLMRELGREKILELLASCRI